MTIEALKQDISLTKTKIKNLQEWLVKHIDSPERWKVLADIRHYDVHLKTKEFNLSQLTKGLPSHGEEMPDETKTDGVRQ